MKKQEWIEPQLKNLGVEFTEEQICFCENGKDEEVITYHGGKPHRPGHGHKPDRPHKPCPPTPCPPDDNETIDPS